MLDIKALIKDAEEMKEVLRAYKDELMLEIKGGNLNLYKKYIEVSADYLESSRDLSKLYAAIEN